MRNNCIGSTSSTNKTCQTAYETALCTTTKITAQVDKNVYKTVEALYILLVSPNTGRHKIGPK